MAKADLFLIFAGTFSIAAGMGFYIARILFGA